MAHVATCPDCGTELPSAGGTEGLCPRCLLSLALVDFDLGAEDQPTLTVGGTGRILGQRYQLREFLGRGGMGEVWRAFDLKLRVDVALKFIRPEHAQSGRAREMLRQEVRAARQVVSPNVCRIFDLIEEDGEELVSMEYIDGTTLGETLRARGPLGLEEARETASQFLLGLEAIHQAGLVHRDFKPENVMLTRAGRVVVMDFGLARGLKEAKTGSVAGTPAYMAPEQARGEAVDARADVFAAGIVLAEMLSAGGDGGQSRQELFRAVRRVPPQVPEGPWAAVLRQALAPDPQARHASAGVLARALEEITLRLPGFEQKHPYPGLASFTAEEAEFFFGREVEVEALWRKIKRPRLLALIGPSGAGKSSFLRAGLLPALPTGWEAVLVTPGNRPFRALAQALVPALSGDRQAMQALLGLEEPDTAVALLSRWRQRHEQALIIVDQFEELFTLNPPEVQQAFATLLGRLVLEADTHVLLSLRDDFLFHCHAHEALAPAFADLTPLGTLSAGALRRALVQPALKCGYRFEDEALVEEMVEEVGRERGALPLLAFAASQLWEKRDREKGLLTRQAYAEIGGVGGALAQHAEATLEKIGAERTPVVREIFRNLVTAQGTRVVAEREGLLSVFAGPPDRRTEAAEVLGALIDARLLTSFEMQEGEGDASRRGQRVEIVHESLLIAWPRLVRWQTQDADGALLRDQLRQAAQMWQDRGQPDDLLWSGTAYRDFSLWRERYRGGLSSTEEAFAQAATRVAGRRRRRRRIATAALLAAAATVAVVTSGLWRQSERARRQAETETVRAEASKLLALGQIELDPYPTAAFAYALKSLELNDSEVGRLFALRAMQRGPMATLTPLMAGSVFNEPAFSPDGRWLALAGAEDVQVFGQDGRGPVRIGGYAEQRVTADAIVGVRFLPDGQAVVAERWGDVRVWSIPEGRELFRGLSEEGFSLLFPRDGDFLTLTTNGKRESLRSWPLGEGQPRLLGQMESLPPARGLRGDISHGTYAYARGPSVYERSIDNWTAPPRLLARHAADVRGVRWSQDGRRLATSDDAGQIRIWSTASRPARPLRLFQAKTPRGLAMDPRGRWLASFVGSDDERVPYGPRLWDLTAPRGAAPMVLRRGGLSQELQAGLGFDSSGRWLVTNQANDAAFWPLDDDHPFVLSGHGSSLVSLAFAPDGKSLVSAAHDGTVRVWPLSAEDDREPRVLFRGVLVAPQLAVDSRSRSVVMTPERGMVLVLPLEGGKARKLATLNPGETSPAACCIALDGSGGAAVAITGVPPGQQGIGIWDLESGAVRKLPPIPGATEADSNDIWGLRFLGRDRLLVSVVEKGLFLYDLKLRTGRLLVHEVDGGFSLSRDERVGIGVRSAGAHLQQSKAVVRFRLDGTPPEILKSHGSQVYTADIDPSGTVVASASIDGTIRIGPISGEEPHVFFGHQGPIWTIAFSPDGRWLASGGTDSTIRLWPVPDLSKPPLHTRPYQDLLASLRSRTNLRAVPDPQSPTGWKIEPGPFLGWASRPED